eukprot:Partr_v1_DN27357_c0_g1_i2_m46357 putative caib baif family
MILGDLGAEVIKIEEPVRGDDTRMWGPPFAKPLSLSSSPESAYFLSVNRNKLSVAVDIKSDAGREIIHKLAAVSDVVVENFVPGKLDSLGLGFSDLSRVNERLVYASISGYGPTGPYAHNPGYDVIIEAEAGFMHITGSEGGDPVKVGVAVTDLTTGLYAHGAVMAALFARERTGRGQRLDLSLFESQLASLANIGSNYLIGGQEASRRGTSHASIVPYQAFRTRDSRIVFGAGNDRQFKTICDALNLAYLSQDPHYSTNAARVKNRDKLVAILEKRLSMEPTSHWLEILKGTGIPNGPVNNIASTFAHPQVSHRDMVVTMQHPTVGEIKLAGIPVGYSDTPPTIRLCPPTHGQHTRQVLADLLRYDNETIGRLAADSIIKI